MRRWIGLSLLLLFLSGCSGSGRFYDWCDKRDFPRICEKYL